MSDLKTTPLHAWHVEHGAKMAPFAGWDMPIQYKGILVEHQQTREKTGVFDICHMGEFHIQGTDAKSFLEKALAHNLETLAPGRCRYGFLLNENGGVIDDCIVYCLDKDDYMVVVNGARTEIDFATLRQRLPESIELTDISNQTAKIDLQGPASMDVLQGILEGPLASLRYFGFFRTTYQGAPLLVSRTGYTGELGYELYVDVSRALPLWEACLADERVQPVGLGARDTLRLEMGLPLYGQDLDEEHTPAEAGYGMMLTSQADYVGREKAGQVRERIVPLALEGRRSARHHDLVLDTSGNQVGHVTSGSFAPSLGYAVALAYVKAEAAETDGFLVKAARAEIPASKAALPFYTKGTARMKVE